MVTEQGIVFKTTPSTVWIKTERGEMCESCDSKDTCGGGCTLLSSTLTELEIEVPNHIGARNGDKVLLSMDSSSVITLSLMAYIVPIIALILGAFLGEKISFFLGTDKNICSIIFGVTSLALSILAVRATSKKISKTNKYQPTITKILKRA